MNAAKELYSDILCHITNDGGLRCNDTETLDLLKRLAEIGETLDNLRSIVCVPLMQLSNIKIDECDILELRRAEGE